MMPDTRRTCEAYEKATAAGEEPTVIVAELATWYGVGRPAIWKRLRAGGLIPPYRSRPGGNRRPEKRRTSAQIDSDKMMQPRVDRDACPRCGVRADIGCKHSRAPVGMTF